jgi:hypothetical protein
VHAAPACRACFACWARRDLEIQLKMEQVHIAPASDRLASHRTAGAGAGGAGGAYRNYGERLYVEGRLDAMRKEQTVGAAAAAAAAAALLLVGGVSVGSSDEGCWWVSVGLRCVWW